MVRHPWQPGSLLAQTSQQLSRFVIIVGFLGLNLSGTTASWAQPDAIAVDEINNVLQSIPIGLSDIATGDITLDGRSLFKIAVLRRQDPEGTQLSLEQRIGTIEARLQQSLQLAADPREIDTTLDFDAESGQYIIRLDDQDLMTVTALEAEIYGFSDQEAGLQIIEYLEAAFEIYYQEHQPAFLIRQSLIAGGIVLLSILVSLLLNKLNDRLEERRNIGEQRIKDLNVQEQSAVVNPETGEYEDPELQAQITKDRNVQRQHLSTIISQQLLIRLGHWALWSSSLTIGLGLVPHTRGLQFLLIRAIRGPIFKLGLIALGIVMAKRVSHTIIDQLFASVEKRRSLGDPTGSNFRLYKRLATVSDVTKSIISTFIIIVGSITGLVLFGVNIGPIISSLGFIGLGLSLAGQDIIKDFMNGILILVEDQYAEGDVIVVDGHGGLVEHLNLRITQLRNTEGTLITIPNSTIRMVHNLSNGWSRVDMAIEVAYNTDLDYAIQVIEQVARYMSYEREWRDQILEAPEIQGVDHFGTNGITIRIWIKVKPLRQWAVAREYRRRLKKAFDRANISIPFSQTELWFRSPLELQHPGPSPDHAVEQPLDSNTTPL